MGCEWHRAYKEAEAECARLNEAYKPRLQRVEGIRRKAHLAYLADCARVRQAHQCKRYPDGICVTIDFQKDCPAAASMKLRLRAMKLQEGISKRLSDAEAKRRHLYWYAPSPREDDDTGDPLSYAGLCAEEVRLSGRWE